MAFNHGIANLGALLFYQGMFTDKSEGSVLTEIIGRVKVNHWRRRGLLIVTAILTIGNILFVDRGSIGPGKLAFPESGLPRGTVHIQDRICIFRDIFPGRIEVQLHTFIGEHHI